MTPATEKPIEQSLTQAADFVRGLSPEAASAIVERLPQEEASKLREAIARIAVRPSDQPIDDSELVSTDGTVELKLSGIEAPQPESLPPAERPQPQTAAPTYGEDWLRSLNEADPRAIADYLSKEQPRAVAAVLSYLPAAIGAGVIQSLPAEEQGNVVAQLAIHKEADPESLRVIATGLAAWLKERSEETNRRQARVATIREIVLASPPATRGRLMRDLQRNEPEIAAALQDLVPANPVPKPAITKPAPTKPVQTPPPSIRFEDLARVDGRTLAQALGQLEARVALLALAGATEDLIKRLESGLPKRVAKDLRTKIHRVGPTTLAEIDQAQAAFSEAVGAIVALRKAARAKQRAGV